MAEKPHVVCVPMPAQGHINPMFTLAKLLHQRGFQVTFVHNEHNYKRLIKSRGFNSINSVPGFRFEAIPDGLSPSDNPDAPQDVPPLIESLAKNGLEPFRRLLARLNDRTDDGVVSPVTCVVSDFTMSFTVEAAEELGVPAVLLYAAAAGGFMTRLIVPELMNKGLIPLKDERDATSGYLDTVIDSISSFKNIRLRDIPFAITTDRNDIMLKLSFDYLAKGPRASAIIINTYEALEHKALEFISSIFPHVLTVGPLHQVLEKTNPNSTVLSSIGSNMWKEENECLNWLDDKEDNSVFYVNFGSSTFMSLEHLKEFAWGLANSMKPFFWVIRSDLVVGDKAVLPPEFLEETRGRGILTGWCAQERVLSHPAIGGFLTHCGWNSVLESLSAGIPMICWPYIAEQPINCWFLCREWGVGMEIEGEVRREEVERLVRELMDGEKGKEMRRNALEWKSKAEEATNPSGSSLVDLDKLINEVLLQRKV